MREIIIKYTGECKKCGASLEIGISTMYEKSMGVFCKGHEPINPEEIRTYRQAKAEHKAQRYDEWANKRESNAHTQLNSYPSIRSDIAFNTQPGHIPLRARMIKADEKAFKSLVVAERMRDKANTLRNIRVAGDAERQRQAIREKLDTLINKGSQIYDAVFGAGVVIGVSKKSYRIEFKSKITPDKPYITSRDKSYIRLAD